MIDKAILEDMYANLLSQKENLENENQALRQEITIFESKLEYEKVRSDGPVAQFRLIQNKNEEIRKLNEKINVLCAKLRENYIYIRECS